MPEPRVGRSQRERLMTSTGKRVKTAFIKRSPPGEWGRWCVWRKREDDSFDLTTCHLFKWRARRAGRIYERTGEVRGFAP